MLQPNKKSGISILGIIFLGIIIILVLSYFNVSIRGIIESPSGQENIHYVGGVAGTIWNNYLAGPASYLWNDVWINIFWKSFIYNMERIRDGKTTVLDEAADNLKIKQ